jgi:hypothetical protein
VKNIDNIADQLEFCNFKLNELTENEAIDEVLKEKLILDYEKQISRLTEIKHKYQLEKEAELDLPKLHLVMTYEYDKSSYDELINYAKVMTNAEV